MNPDEIEVRNFLEVYRHEMTSLYEKPDPESPKILALVASPLKEHMTGVMERYTREGWYFKRNDPGPPPYRLETLDMVDRDTAVAFECVVDDFVTYERGTDEPVAAEVTRHAVETTVARPADGQWRVSSKKLLTSRDAERRCDGLS